MRDQVLCRKRTINCKGKIIDLSIPKVMGILNLSSDSFYDGGKYSSIDKIRTQIIKMISEGADFIDIGAASSRPGSKLIDAKEERDNLKPVLEIISKEFSDLVISIDTYNSDTANCAVQEYGVSVINDISGGNIDRNMFKTIVQLQVPYVLMHMQGTPATMQIEPAYKNILEDLIQYFSKKVQKLNDLGAHDVILDPGFGFGKTMDHNYDLLHNFHEFGIFSLPLMAGVSRKSMIYKLFNCSPNEALNGTTVLNTIALLKGANILRVHDVLEAKQAIQLVEKCGSLPDIF